MKIKIAYHVKGKERRMLAEAVSKMLHTVPRYLSVPTCAYEMDGCLVDREGTLSIDSAIGAEQIKAITDYLREKGFNGEPLDDPRYTTIRVIDPKLSKDGIARLRQICENRNELFQRAFQTRNRLGFFEDNEGIVFPWFPKSARENETAAYTIFCSKLCAMAERQKRVLAPKKNDMDNDKYAFRCYLLRLGLIGDEYRETRKILLRRLDGDSAFRHGKKKSETE